MTTSEVRTFPVLLDSVQQSDQSWVHSCGQQILGAKVCLSILDGSFPLSGGGEVQQVVVPYCPSCEDQPAFRGSIAPDGTISHPNF